MQGKEINFCEISDPIAFSNRTKNSQITLKNVKKGQRRTEGSMKNFSKGGKKPEELKEAANINRHFN